MYEANTAARPCTGLPSMEMRKWQNFCSAINRHWNCWTMTFTQLPSAGRLTALKTAGTGRPEITPEQSKRFLTPALNLRRHSQALQQFANYFERTASKPSRVAHFARLVVLKRKTVPNSHLIGRPSLHTAPDTQIVSRSEERRVAKEGRARG